MRKFVIILILLNAFIPNECYSQPREKIDSLNIVLSKEKADSTRMKILESLITVCINSGNFEEAIQYNQQLKSIASQVAGSGKDENYVRAFGKQGIANSFTNFGKIYTNQGKLEEAMLNFKSAIVIYEDIGSVRGLANSYLNIGSTYAQQGDMQQAKINLEKSKKYYEELKDTVGLVALLNNMGSVNVYLGNYPEALKIYLATLKITEAKGDKNTVAHTYNNIGYLYDVQGKYDDAMKYYLLALKNFEEIGGKRGMAFSYNNIGVVYAEKNNYAEAIKYYNQSLTVAKEIGDNYSIAQNLNNIGEAYAHEGRDDEALENFFAAQKIFIEANDQANIATVYMSIAKIYSKQKRYSEAEINFKNCLDLARKSEARQVIIDCYYHLAELYENKNDLKNAVTYLKLHRELNDSILNESNNRQIAEMKTKYESEKKDAEIGLLSKDKEVKELEIKKQKTLKYSFIGGLALFGILSFFVFTSIRTKQKLKLQTLRNKIASDLHDEVGSTLSSIALFSAVAKDQSGEVMPMLQNISDSSRKMLESMADIVWTINPENDNFENIILRMRSFAYELLGAKKIDFEFKADETVAQMKLSMETRKNLYLIFKEAINNLVKYSEANRASFAITGSKGNLTMLIRDNGKGFDTQKITQGNGLKNMKKRAEDIGAQFLIESETGNGTTIQLILKAA